MKERVIILAEGGACGHFICTLLQTLHVPEIFPTLEMPEHGSMDLIAEIGSLTYKYSLDENKFHIYPEREEAMDLIMYAFNNPDSTYKPYQRDYEKKFHEIHVIHYQWKDNIDKFLSLPNTRVIFVRYDLEDAKRIAVNKITKNFNIEAMATDEFARSRSRSHYYSLLKWAKFDEAAEELKSLNSVKEVSKSLIDTLIKAWQHYITLRQVWCSPEPHENLTILNFNDLYFNKEIIMQSLSEFTGLPINKSTHALYDKYLSKQPNIDLY